MIRDKRFHLSVLLLTIIMVLGFATLCMASGDASGTAIPQPAGKTPAFGNLFVVGWTAVNFFFLLALLYKFAFNPINAMMDQRAATIESSLKHAEEVRIEIDQMKKETQANLADSRKEAQEIVARATKAAEDAKTEIVNKAHEEADNFKVKAKAEIEAATEQAKKELKDTSAVLAIMAAEKLLGRAITDEDHKKMVDQFVNEAGDMLC